ncbi:hypothetical protein [Actibacterium lipolyticum]|nr:hypothetical protein [Actibacterium lipolyticum]
MLGLFALAAAPVSAMPHDGIGMHDCIECPDAGQSAEHHDMDPSNCFHGVTCMAVALLPLAIDTHVANPFREVFPYLDDRMTAPADVSLVLPPPRVI